MFRYKKSLWTVVGLIVALSAILAMVAEDKSVLAKWVAPPPETDAGLTIDTHLVQDKVLVGSDGKVAVALTLTAPAMESSSRRPTPFSDLVIVMDRSGSMSGRKIDDARQAVLHLIDRLSVDDRLALVSYANDVRTVFPLAPMDDAHRQQARTAVNQVYAGGGTNLGGGLYQGIETLMHAPAAGRQRRVILISDGLANQGITDPGALGNMAAGAVEHNFNVSTVGVGYDFNEILMTTIADHGAGRYYFLENPNAFARVFEKELQSTRNVAASGLEIRIPLTDGVQLVHAGGYPIEVNNGYATIHPGDLLSSQQRKLFLTFKVPTRQEEKMILGSLKVHYQQDGISYDVAGKERLEIACVADKADVISSIDRAAWGEQVVKEDYNQLKEEVATAIRKGKKGQALRQIQEYEGRHRSVNAAVGSAKVTKNLDQDVQRLRDSVEDTFAGSPAAVAEKKKQKSKALQYESYQIRRDKK